MERRYTVSEIEALRNVCKTILTFGDAIPPEWFEGTFEQWEFYRPRSPEGRMERVVSCEEMVRTYMTGGVTAEEIVAEHRRAKREGKTK